MRSSEVEECNAACTHVCGEGGRSRSWPTPYLRHTWGFLYTTRMPRVDHPMCNTVHTTTDQRCLWMPPCPCLLLMRRRLENDAVPRIPPAYQANDCDAQPLMCCISEQTTARLNHSCAEVILVLDDPEVRKLSTKTSYISPECSTIHQLYRVASVI